MKDFDDVKKQLPIFYYSRTDYYFQYPRKLWNQKPNAEMLVLFAITESLKRDLGIGLDISTSESSEGVPYELSEEEKQQKSFAEENLERYIVKYLEAQQDHAKTVQEEESSEEKSEESIKEELAKSGIKIEEL